MFSVLKFNSSKSCYPALNIILFHYYKVAHGIEPKTQEVVCKPEHFKCPDGYELDLVVYGCVKIKPPTTLPPTTSFCPPGRFPVQFPGGICKCEEVVTENVTIFSPRICPMVGNFKLDQLGCQCISKPIPPPCPPGKILDPKTSKCVCSQPVKCNPLQKFNEESCECECRKVIIPVAPRRRRPIIADRCPKGAKTNSKCRCVFNRHHY